MGNNVSLLLKETISVWKIFNLLPAYSNCKKKAKRRIKNCMNNAYKHVQIKFIKRLEKVVGAKSNIQCVIPDPIQRSKGSKSLHDNNIVALLLALNGAVVSNAHSLQYGKYFASSSLMLQTLYRIMLWHKCFQLKARDKDIMVM